MFDEIERVLLQYQADLHTMLFDKESGMQTKLIYSTHPEAFADLPLSSGRFLTAEENHSELFLSTVETGEAAQIGRIAKIHAGPGTLRSGRCTAGWARAFSTGRSRWCCPTRRNIRRSLRRWRRRGTRSGT